MILSRYALGQSLGQALGTSDRSMHQSRFIRTVDFRFIRGGRNQSGRGRTLLIREEAGRSGGGSRGRHRRSGLDGHGNAHSTADQLGAGRRWHTGGSRYRIDSERRRDLILGGMGHEGALMVYSTSTIGVLFSECRIHEGDGGAGIGRQLMVDAGGWRMMQRSNDQGSIGSRGREHGGGRSAGRGRRLISHSHRLLLTEVGGASGGGWRRQIGGWRRRRLAAIIVALLCQDLKLIAN